MTTRLYYQDSFLYDFDAEVRDVVDSPRPALILDRTAFYPTSGGQVFDTGWISSDAGSSGSRRDRRGAPPRSHATTFRSACPFRSFSASLQHADCLVPHGRPVLLH